MKTKQIKPSTTTKHLNGEMVKSGQFKNIRISIVGKYLGINKKDKSLLDFEAADKINFNVRINQTMQWVEFSTSFVEIRGHIQDDNIIINECFSSWGNDFDFKLWNEFVKLSHRYSNLF